MAGGEFPVVNEVEWRKLSSGKKTYPGVDDVTMERKMRVNGRNMLSLDYSRKAMVEQVYDDHAQLKINIKVFIYLMMSEVTS